MGAKPPVDFEAGAERAPAEPSQSLPPEARGLFTLAALGAAAPTALVALIAGRATVALGGADWVGIAVAAAGAMAAASIAVALARVRWRRWRYELRDEEIDLLHGALVVTRTLVPIVRVQHVDTRRTWLSDRFGLRSVVVHTAGGSHAIPGLREPDATAIRDRIALLAREPDDD